MKGLFIFIACDCFLKYGPQTGLLNQCMRLVTHLYKYTFIASIALISTSALISIYDRIKESKWNVKGKEKKQNKKKEDATNIVKEIPYREVIEKNAHPTDPKEALLRERENLIKMKEKEEEKNKTRILL